MITNNCYVDVYKWIESMINSSKTYDQTLVVDKIIDQFEFLYKRKLPHYIVSDLVRILRKQMTTKWIAMGIVVD